jgi:hypothetical protein
MDLGVELLWPDDRDLKRQFCGAVDNDFADNAPSCDSFV